MKLRLPLDKSVDFSIEENNCSGCALCQLACSFIKTSAFSLANSLIYIDRDLTKRANERYTIRLSPSCDSCGFCVNYCGFGALTNFKRAKKTSG